LLVGPLVFVKNNANGLGIILDVTVGGVLVGWGGRIAGGAPGVSHDGFEYALLAIVIALRTPESSHGRLEGGGDVIRGWK